MKTKTYIALSGFTSLILVIVGLVLGFNYLRKRFIEIFQIDYLSQNQKCDVTDDDGNPVIDEENGSIFGRMFDENGLYSIEYCALHPLMLTDKEFRANTLTLYGGPTKILTSIKKFYDGVWKVPDKGLIEADPVLSTMVLNPWYTSDDVYFTPVKVEYTTDLSTFIVDGKKLVGLKATGLNLSWGESVINYNDVKLEKCKGPDLAKCEVNPSTCDCKLQNVRQYYLYIDNNLVIELPIQLYLGKEGKKTENIQIKVGGKMKNKAIEPLQIKTIDDLDTIIEDKFFKFKYKIGDKCEKLVDKKFNSYDEFCKFFKWDGLEGIVITLRRILVIHLPSDVIDKYIDRVDKKVNRTIQVNYLEFFLWLACKSYRDKISYYFKPVKLKKR
jgi:hypothetical protein